jgi:hypothetical protein
LHQAIDQREAPGPPGALFVAADLAGGVVEKIKVKVPLKKTAQTRVAQEPGSRS